MSKPSRKTIDGAGIDRSASFKVLLSSLLVNSVEDDEEENAMLSKAERRMKRRKQVRSLDSAPKPDVSRFVNKPTTNTRGLSFGGKNNKAAVAVSPVAGSPVFTVPSSPLNVSSTTSPNSKSNTRPNSPRTLTSTPSYSSTKKGSSSFLQRTLSANGTVITVPYSREAIKGLNLHQQELRILKQSFDRIDEDQNGIIDKLEFLHALGEKDEISNLFVDKVFDMIDFDGDEGINFDEFIHMSGMSTFTSHLLHLLHN